MLSRDTYPSNIASLLLALTLFVLAPGNLKTIKIKAHTGSVALRLYQHWSYFLWWQVRQLFSLCHRCFCYPLDIMFTSLLIFLWISPLCHQHCFQISISKHWFGKSRERKPYWFVVTVVHGNCGSLLFLENGSKRRRTNEDPAWLDRCHSSWNINILPQKDATSIWEQTRSFRIAMRRSIAQEKAGDETRLLSWLWPLTSDCIASVCCYCYKDRWCPYDIGLVLEGHISSHGQS